MSQLTSSGIIFGNGQLLTKDPLRVMTQLNGLGINSYANSTSRKIWDNSYSSPIGIRGVMYGVAYTTDGKGTWVSQGAVNVTVTNFTDVTLRVNVVAGVYDFTDDSYRYVLYRDGSQTNSSTHSGGTMIIDSGTVNTSGAGGTLYTTSVTQDISANSSTTLWLYAGVMSGSSGDYLCPYIATSFNSFP